MYLEALTERKRWIAEVKAVDPTVDRGPTSGDP